MKILFGILIILGLGMSVYLIFDGIVKYKNGSVSLDTKRFFSSNLAEYSGVELIVIGCLGFASALFFAWIVF